MITVKEVILWFRTEYPALAFFNSFVDKDKEKAIGVYERVRYQQPRAIGQKSSYGYKPLTLLVRWGKNADECERQALEIKEFIENATADETIGGRSCFVTEISGPVNLDCDEKGIFERVIDFTICYRKE